MVNLYTPQEGKEIRSVCEQIRFGANPNDFYMGLTEGIGPFPKVIVSSGRSTCRVCGQKIKKGEPALSYVHDFHGDGSWTAVDVYVHLNDCPKD